MFRVLSVVVGVVASSMGCAQLAGIGETNGHGRNGNSLAVTRMSIGNTVVNTPLDLTGLTATYLVPAATAGSFEAAPADPSTSAPGTWTKDLPDAAPVEFTLPELPAPIPRLVAFPSRQLSVVFAPLEHPDPAPAPDMAMLTVTAPLDAVPGLNDSFEVYTVGSWTSHVLPTSATAQIGPTAYAFNTSNNLSGRPTFDRLTMQDALLVLRYSGPSLTGALTGVAEAMPFDQSGADVVTTPKMAPVAPDQTLDVKITSAAFTMRYAAVRPAVAGLAMNWSLVAAPGYRIASNAGPALQSGAAIDPGVKVTYGNPFAARGWNTIFTLATSESRTVTPMGTTLPVTLSAGMNQFLEPSLASPGFNLDLPAGLPVLIAIDGKQLSTDGQMIAQPTKFAQVTFLPDNSNATLFNLQVFDLLPNAAKTALEYHQVFAAASNATTATGEATFEVPPEIFQAGHSYTMRALCLFGGYPGIASGDLATRELPLAQSFLDSGVFTVMP